MRFAKRVCVMSVGLLAVAAVGVRADSVAERYVLKAGSRYAQGCFGVGWRPCKCPIRMADSFVGSFLLAPAFGEDPVWEVYTVDDVDWTAVLDEPITIAGSGTYQIGMVEGEPVQRLMLDLVVGGGAPRWFDSGVVPGGDLAEIVIGIRMPDSECLNVVMDLVAIPAPAGDYEPDGDVDLSDFAVFAMCYGASVAAPPSGCTAEQAQRSDLNGDAMVDLADFAIFAASFGQ